MKGGECAQCPLDRYTKDPNGTLLCCHGCEAADLYYGTFPHSWCVCFTKGEDPVPGDSGFSWSFASL